MTTERLTTTTVYSPLSAEERRQARARTRLESVRKHGYAKFVDQFLPLGERLDFDASGGLPTSFDREGSSLFAAYGHQAGAAVVPVLFGWVDSYSSESHHLRSSKTEYPLESGASITDHLVVNPARLQLTGFVSDLLYSSWSKSKVPTARAQAAWQEITRLHAERSILDVTTTLGDYQNMVIMNVSATVNSSTGVALRFRIDFEEVQTRDVEFVSFSRTIDAAVEGTDIYDPLSSLLHDAGAAGLPEGATDEEIEEYTKRVTLKRPEPPEVRLLRYEYDRTTLRPGVASRAGQWARQYTEDNPGTWLSRTILPLFGQSPEDIAEDAPPVFNIQLTDDARQHWSFHHAGIDYDIDMWWNASQNGWYMRVIDGGTRNRSYQNGGVRPFRSGGLVLGGVPLLNVSPSEESFWESYYGGAEVETRLGELVAVPLVNTTEPPGRFDWNVKYELVFFSRSAIIEGAVEAVTQ